MTGTPSTSVMIRNWADAEEEAQGGGAPRAVRDQDQDTPAVETGPVQGLCGQAADLRLREKTVRIALADEHDFSPVYTPLKAENPPSMGTTTPVTNAEAGDRSQNTVPSRSAGWPNRPMGVCSRMARPRGVRPPVRSSKSR